MAYTGLKQGVRITLHKNIPMGAGLAGGSSDAAAVIQGMNGLFALQLSPAEMLRLGAELGSDVPFCISGGTAFCTGRGELVQSLPDPARELCFVLVTPDLMVSTAEVYAAFSPEKVKERPQEEEFQQAWRKGDMAGLFPAMKNVLESVSISKWPQIGALKQQMQALGARHTLMSGSGPTVFGIFPDALQAQQAANKLKTQYQTVSVCRSFCGLTSEV
jgi:4-diphosphocytidyl-2-C-methyl-D-erythritol kinase